MPQPALRSKVARDERQHLVLLNKVREVVGNRLQDLVLLYAAVPIQVVGVTDASATSMSTMMMAPVPELSVAVRLTVYVCPNASVTAWPSRICPVSSSTVKRARSPRSAHR